MRTVIYAALLLAAPAAAEPVPAASTCHVTIARAPDDVRQVVDAWVRSEAQCSVSLEVRIVPTEGGLYLLAQDERGRMRERIVPDAQTAGVLVASWIADDNAPFVPPVVAPPPTTPIAEPATAPIRTNESLSPPGLAPTTISETAPRPTRRSSWISASGLFPMSESSGAGIRAEVDILRRGRWAFGAASSYTESEGFLYTSSGSGSISTQDFKLVAYAAPAWSRGAWHLRPALGAGILVTRGAAYDFGAGMSYDLAGTFPTLEASVVVSRDLGTSWALYGGPLATLVAQQFRTYSSTQPYEMLIQRGVVDAALLIGVRRRL